jgi:hypothetical protein
VHRRLGPAPAALHGDLEQARVGLLDALIVRVQGQVEVAGQVQALQHRVESPVGVGDHHPLRRERRESLQALARAAAEPLPEVVLGVVGVDLGQGLGGAGPRPHPRALQDQIHVEPAPAPVRGARHRAGRVEAAAGVGVGGLERRRLHPDAAARERGAHPLPVGLDDDAARVQEEGFERGAHGVASRHHVILPARA